MVALMCALFYSGAGQYMIPNMYMAGNPLDVYKRQYKRCMQRCSKPVDGKREAVAVCA